MIEVETVESETEQSASAILPRTAFEIPEWYGPPGSTGGSSDSAAETPWPTSLTMHPDVSLAAAMLSSDIQDSDAALASTPEEDTSEPYAELPAVIMLPATEDWALDQLQQRCRALLDITNSRLWHQPSLPLPGMMADLQQAVDADDYSDMPELVDSDDEDEFPALASPLPAMMAELQLAEEATPPASETGSLSFRPSRAFASADLPLLGEETVVEPMLTFEKPGLTEFVYNLHGSKFEIEVDHYALKWLMNSVHTGRLARWGIKLSGYDFTVKHQTGKMHGNADAVSRAPIATKAISFIATALKRSAPTADSEDDYHITYAEFDQQRYQSGKRWGCLGEHAGYVRG